MAVVSTSPQSEQATVISTLLLWRNLGMVFGIASSSLILRETLAHYLDLLVIGDMKNEIIMRVTNSVEAVLTVEEPYQGQVRQSYGAALSSTFGCCTLIAFIGLLIVLPIKLPRLGAKKVS